MNVKEELGCLEMVYSSAYQVLEYRKNLELALKEKYDEKTVRRANEHVLDSEGALDGVVMLINKIGSSRLVHLIDNAIDLAEKDFTRGEPFHRENAVDAAKKVRLGKWYKGEENQ